MVYLLAAIKSFANLWFYLYKVGVRKMDIDCEKTCIAFQTLDPRIKNVELAVRLDFLERGRPSNLPNTLCGGCINRTIINSSINRQINKLVIKQ